MPQVTLTQIVQLREWLRPTHQPGPDSARRHRLPAVLVLALALLSLFGTACDKTLASMVSDVSPGVVQIVTPFRTGSGFIVDEDGLVITNAHVVQPFETVDVRLASGQQYHAEVLRVDEIADLALLDLRASRDFRSVPLVSCL